MPLPIRNLGQFTGGEGISTPPTVRRRLAISLLKVTGVIGRGASRRRGGRRG